MNFIKVQGVSSRKTTPLIPKRGDILEDNRGFIVRIDDVFNDGCDGFCTYTYIKVPGYGKDLLGKSFNDGLNTWDYFKLANYRRTKLWKTLNGEI